MSGNKNLPMLLKWALLFKVSNIKFNTSSVFTKKFAQLILFSSLFLIVPFVGYAKYQFWNESQITLLLVVVTPGYLLYYSLAILSIKMRILENIALNGEFKDIPKDIRKLSENEYRSVNKVEKEAILDSQTKQDIFESFLKKDIDWFESKLHYVHKIIVVGFIIIVILW